MTERSECPNCEGKGYWYCDCLGAECTHEGGKVYCAACQGTGHKPTDAGVPEAQKHRGAHQVLNPPDAPRSAGVKRYDVAGFPEGDGSVFQFERKEGKYVLATDYASLEADNASLRASLAEFKGDYGKLVDLEGQAQARVAALEAERDRMADEMELHRKRAYTLGVAYLDEVVDDEEPRPSKQYTFEETVLVARAAVAALHPTSEAEL